MWGASGFGDGGGLGGPAHQESVAGFKAIAHALLPKRNRKDITSLIEEFQYPKLGPGMMWERCADKLAAAGVTVECNTSVDRVLRGENGATAVVVAGPDGRREVPATAVDLLMPLSALARAMDSPAPPNVIAAADDLYYRDFLTVALVVPADKSPGTTTGFTFMTPESGRCASRFSGPGRLT